MSAIINCDKTYCDDYFKVCRPSADVTNPSLELNNSNMSDEWRREAVNAHRQLTQLSFRTFVYMFSGYTLKQKQLEMEAFLR